MSDDHVSATTVMGATAAAVFAVLADPSQHAAIDGTGWVCEPVDDQPLTATGQLFRMSMFHRNHPDGGYQTINRIEVFEPPAAIAWKPGYDADDGTLGFGGWVWRYDLEPAGADATRVTLTYDWSAVPDDIRERIGFPPFGPDHLANSLTHLAALVT